MRRFLAAFWLIVLALSSPAAAQDKRIALTFDDVPRQVGAFFTPEERTERLIAALREAGVEQAAFFVTTGNLENPDGAGGEARIAAYVAAGHVIANHSHDHTRLSKTEADAYLADIDRASAWLAGRPGYRAWFRFPYLDEGGRDLARRDALREGLGARGLRNGYVTADGSDWHLEQLTIDAKRDGKPMDMKALRKLYLQSQMSGIAYHEALARRTLGRVPPQVMLLHETDLAALFIGDLVAELRKDGWTIITADEAYADAELAAAMPDVPYTSGTLTGMMAWERDIQPPLAPLWMGTEMMSWLFETKVLVKPEDGK
ncbi:polysaccharide deacetylase family protein [Porphyrobacter sp. YT40]|uniref:polysaccharide deacetylase family protein n=1 Tax=Porphyrobacter sp. YT40 TaxID=2547601 RepID=UPI0011447771|nr:polysaccharide deacetylase family protein [Porphyrobacter sp. YT40]QDH33952.1 polysaccharide deacetylase family protein [Porphyrobacter sp. YT40]